MGAPRAWTTVSGQDTDERPLAVVGQESLRTVYFNPNFARIEIDTTVTPPRVVVSSPALEALDRGLDDLADELDAAEAATTALAARVTALETKRFTLTAQKDADYTAVAWEHVLVDMDAAAGDVTITMPTSPAPAINDRVRVSDVSADGGVGLGFALKVAASFGLTSTTHYASSPYSVAFSASDGGSLRGASIELVYAETGWFVVSETCKPSGLL